MANSSLSVFLFFFRGVSNEGLKKRGALFSHANILFYMQSLTSWNILTDSLFFNTVGQQCKEAAALRHFFTCSIEAEVHPWISLESHCTSQWRLAKFDATEEPLAFFSFAAEGMEWSCGSDILYYVLTALGSSYNDRFFAFCTALFHQHETLTTYSWRYSGQRDCDAPKQSALCRRHCDSVRLCDACRATCQIQRSPSKQFNCPRVHLTASPRRACAGTGARRVCGAPVG